MTTSTKNYTTQYIIAGVVGLAFIGYQTTAKNNATSVGNLPATNEKVDTNSRAINDLREQLTREIGVLRDQMTTAIKDVEEDGDNDLAAEANLIRSEINRREKEQVKYIDTLDVKKHQRMDRLENRLGRDEDLLIEHMNNPPAKHIRAE